MNATYLADENCLQELPDRERPNINDFVDPVWCPTGNCQAYHEEMAAYYKELAKCRRIPCSPECKGLWADQQKVVENVDYEVKKHCEHNDNCLLSTACISCDDKAFPLVPVREDDLWHKAINLIMAAHDKGLSKEDAVGVVKSQFTITPKH